MKSCTDVQESIGICQNLYYIRKIVYNNKKIVKNASNANALRDIFLLNFLRSLVFKEKNVRYQREKCAKTRVKKNKNISLQMHSVKLFISTFFTF